MSGHDPDELSAYALGMLDAGARTLVEAHLRHCERCRVDLRELRESTHALDRLPVETFVHEPPDGDRALQAALRQMQKERMQQEQTQQDQTQQNQTQRERRAES